MSGLCLVCEQPGCQSSSHDQRPGYVYVATSWRNELQPALMRLLAGNGIDAYDFRNPPNQAGFGWEKVALPDPCSAPEYLRGIEHPLAIEGYLADFAAMEKADTFVLVLPCGRSAHLELGWAVGAGKRTAILFTDLAEVTPELMYRMVDKIFTSPVDLLHWLGVDDEQAVSA